MLPRLITVIIILSLSLMQMSTCIVIAKPSNSSDTTTTTAIPITATTTAKVKLEPLDEMTVLIKNFLTALFETIQGSSTSTSESIATKEQEIQEADKENELDSNQKDRKLTPIDLTKPFVFDDEDEIMNASIENSTRKYIEEMTTGKMYWPWLPSLLVQTTQRRQEMEESEKKVTKREASPGWIIFPDSDDPEIRLPEVAVPNPTNQCEEHETFYKMKCEPLFCQGPCEQDEHLIEDNETGESKCMKTNCKYPNTVMLAGKSGECVQMRYHMCPEGMRLTMSRSGEAECDCKPGFLYSSEHGKCYEAFKRGPCRNRQYFIIHGKPNSKNPESESSELESESKRMPKCIRNPCRENGLVCYGHPTCRGQRGMENCVKLSSPCDNGNGILSVNEKTLELECGPLDSFKSGEIDTRILSQVPELACAPGTKRDLVGKCRATGRFVVERTNRTKNTRPTRKPTMETTLSDSD